MKRIWNIMRSLPRAIRLVLAQQKWQGEQRQFDRAEADRAWAPGYSALADRAQALGWHGAGGFWSLCTWACVRSDDCAGPRREAGIRRALAEVERAIEQRERQIGGRLHSVN